jgi:hypothetical protein
MVVDPERGTVVDQGVVVGRVVGGLVAHKGLKNSKLFLLTTIKIMSLFFKAKEKLYY